MSFKKIIFFILPLLLLTAVYLVSRSNRSSQAQNLLTVGIASGYAPFISVNERGNYEGFDIDVITAVAQKMGKRLKLRDLGSMTSLLMALDQEKVDAVIWGLSITQDRLKKIAMVNYQGETTTSYPLLFWKKIPDPIASINDMKGMVVCVEPTSSQDGVLSKYTFITKKPTEAVDDALLNIQYAKADAAFVEPAIAKKFKAKYPEIQLLDVALAPEDQVQGIGIGVKKTNTPLIEALEIAVAQLKRDGTFAEYEKKWDIA